MQTVLIVQTDPALAALWARHISRMGYAVCQSHSAGHAIEVLGQKSVSLIVLDIGASLDATTTVADYAAYRRPDAKVIFVTTSRFFSDGSIFALNRNACALLPCATPPADLAVMVDHHCRAGRPGAEEQASGH